MALPAEPRQTPYNIFNYIFDSPQKSFFNRSWPTSNPDFVSNPCPRQFPHTRHRIGIYTCFYTTSFYPRISMFFSGAYQSAGVAPYALVVSDTVCEVFILLPSNQPTGNRKRAPETRALGGPEHEFAKRLSDAEALHCIS